MIPYLILAIEDDDDRAFMTNLYMKYHLLLYKEILEITHNRPKKFVNRFSAFHVNFF